MSNPERARESRVCRALRKINATGAAIEFSGGNDEGGVDSIELRFADGGQRDLDEHLTHRWNMDRDSPDFGPHEITLTPEQALENEVYAELENIVYDRYGSFAGEFRVDGTVTVDLDQPRGKRIQWTGTEASYVEYSI